MDVYNRLESLGDPGCLTIRASLWLTVRENGSMHITRPLNAADGGPAYLAVHPGSDLFGSDRMFRESVRGMVEGGARVVAILPERGPLVSLLRQDGASVVIAPVFVLRKALLRPKNWARLLRDAGNGLSAGVRLLRRHRPDAVYVNTITVPQWPLIASLFRVPVVSHVHEAEQAGGIWSSRVLYSPHLLARTVVTNSAFSVRTMARCFAMLQTQSIVIPNGIRSPDDVPPAREEIDELRILYIGRLSPRKGANVAVDALSLLRRRGVSSSLRIVGSVYAGNEWYEEELRGSVEAQGLSNNVDFAGFVSDVWPEIARGDVVVVPSTVDESFGNTAVEAVLGRRPVIVSDLAGLKEAVSAYASALVVPAGDPQALADALEDVARTYGTSARATTASAQLARDRHSPITYREAIARVMVEASIR